MELLEPLVLVVVQEQMEVVDLVVTQEHQVGMVRQAHLAQVERVDLVDVMVQEVRLDPQERVQLQVLQQAQVAQEVQELLEAQVSLVIDIEHLLQVS
jgi:hypothetical protein